MSLVRKTFFALLLFITTLGSAHASILDGNGVEGWGTVINGPPGSYAVYASAYEACERQRNEYAPHSPFIGTDNGWPTAGCQWSTVIGDSYPASVVFTCAWGYTRVFPARCVLSEQFRPRPPASDCLPCSEGFFAGETVSAFVGEDPIELLNGTLFRSETDFSTSDNLLSVSRSHSSQPISYPVTSGGWAFDSGPILSMGVDLTLTYPDGTYFYFWWSSGLNTFVPEADQYDRFQLSYAGGGSFNYSTRNSTSTTWEITDLREGKTYTLATEQRPGESNYVYGFTTEIEHRGGYTWTLARGSDNEVTSIVDSFGRQLTFTWATVWQGAGATAYKTQLTQVDLPDGTALKYTWETGYSNLPSGGTAWDRLITLEHLVDPNGSGPSNVISETNYVYEDDRFPNALTGVVDARGERYATWAYNGDGRVDEHFLGVDADHIDIEYTSDTHARNRIVTNPYGKELTYHFDFWWGNSLYQGMSTAATTNTPATLNQVWQYGWGPVTAINEANVRTDFTRNYNGGLPSAITQATSTGDERVTYYTWRTGSDYQIEQIDEPGLTTEFAYNGDGLVETVTQTDTTSHTVPYVTAGEERIWEYTYTAEGLIESVDGPLPGTGDTIDYIYDADGYLETVTDELNHLTTILDVDDLGRPLEIEDVNGIVTELAYSPAGFLETITVDPSGADVVTTIGYDEVGQVTSILKEDGSEYVYDYDEARRLISITDANGNVLEFVPNATGGIAATTITTSGSTLLYEQTATFDELGRVLTSVGAGSATWEYGFDDVGNLTSITDPRTNESTQAFNLLNELIQTVDQSTNTVDLVRDDQGRVTTHTDPRSFDTDYVLNGWGEVIQESSPDIGTVVYERNELGLVIEKTDARSIVTEYAYDDAGRLTDITYPGSGSEDVTFAYDDTTGGNLGVGRLTEIVDPTGTTSRTYNSLGLLETETVDVLSTLRVTEYEYDDAGNIETVTYPSGRTVSYWRDTEGFINAVSTKETPLDMPEDIVDEVDWQPFGTEILSMDFANGLNLWRTYDTDYRPDQLSLYDSSTPLIQHYYGYQDDLNLTDIWDNLNSANDESYWYAANNMLQNADGPWGEDEYYQDGVGNLTWHINDDGMTTTSDELIYANTSNRIEEVERNSSTLRTFTHDAAGNMATSVQGGVTTAYTYNHADRLASFTRNSTPIGAYLYNAKGQLVIRTVTNTVPSGVTVYFYDQDGHVIAEYDGVGGGLIREYIWLGDVPVVVIDPGSPSTTYYVHTDHLNRPIAMTNSGKSFVARYVWTAFGELHSYTGTKGIDLRFPGQLFQAESGLHYNWFRTYDPTTAAYTQPDPIGLNGGVSRYAYTAADPLQKVDEQGLQFISDDRMKHILKEHSWTTTNKWKYNSRFLPHFSSPEGIQDLVDSAFQPTIVSGTPKLWDYGIWQRLCRRYRLYPGTGEMIPEFVGVDKDGNLTNTYIVRYYPDTGNVVTTFPYEMLPVGAQPFDN